MPNTVIRARVRHETAHAFLLEIGKESHWVSRRFCRYKSVHNGELIVPTWLVKKWGQYVEDDLPALVYSHQLTGGVNIRPKPNQANQQWAFDKLYNLAVFALFMQVRAGKTKVAIDILCNHATNGHIDKVLWFCPLSVIETAKEEWQKHAVMDLPVVFVGLETVSGCSRERFERDTASMDTRCAVIVDESHMIKNGRSVRVRRLSPLLEMAPVKGLLSGTPITRNVDDLYHQIYVLDWRIFNYRSWHQFQNNHLVMSEKFPGLVYSTKNTEYLAKRLAPFSFEWFDSYTKRIKTDSIYLQLSKVQLQKYDEIKAVIIHRLENFTEKRGDIFLMFTALSGVMSGYLSKRVMQSLFGSQAGAIYLPCPKVEALLKCLNNLNEKAIVWCARRHDIDLLASKLPEATVITGSVLPSERHRLIQSFRQSKNGVLLAMVQVARRGINLSECSQVFYYSHSFDYEAREQSQARTLLPSKQEVCYYNDLVYENGLDGRILQSHDKKANIIQDFLTLLKQDRKQAIETLKTL